jgi:hypothetical protein
MFHGLMNNPVFHIHHCMDLYIHSPIRLHGVVLNYLSTGTTLLLPLPYLFFPFGATAHIWALAYLHETLRFTSVF